MVLFDESLPKLLTATRRELGDDALERSTILREAAGRLTLLYDGQLSAERRQSLIAAIASQLGPYAREDRPVADRNDTGVARLLDQEPRQWLPFDGRRIRYIDRRIVGADWLTSLAPETFPPRVVFSSLKGGVGRTTALCVAAVELARRRKNVLVIDFDLEAPGAGGLLLSQDSIPALGVIDFMVESVLAELTDEFARDMVGASVLPQDIAGRVDVVPAYGTATQPENYLAKLSRALLDVGPQSKALPVHTKAAQLLESVTAVRSYDVVLVDARAGLGELSAVPFLSLGATVLMFGTAQQQTIEGYRILFAHLATLIKPETGSPWDRLRTILAKAPPQPELNKWFTEEMHTLFQEYLYEEIEGTEGFNYDLNDPEGAHYPVPIPLNPLFATWDPIRRPGEFAQTFYDATFRPFLDALTRRIEARP